MQHFKNIRAAIKKAIDDNATTVQKTYTYERSTFEGFPAVIITPSADQSDYHDNQKDRSVFVFKIRAYYPISNEASHEAAESALETVIDELITIFFRRDCLGSACDWLEPILGTWYYEERGEGIYRVAELTLHCIKYIS